VIRVPNLSPSQVSQALPVLDAAQKHDALIAAYQRPGDPKKSEAAWLEAEARKRESGYWRLPESPQGRSR
jgi:hypothetical protein